MADAIEVVNALVLLDRNHKILLPDNLKAANEYVTNGRTADFTAAMVGFLAARTKLVDYREYLANVRQLFYHLPENQTLDGATSWPRWLETHFGAHEKLKKDYFNQLARPKREKNCLPKTDTDRTTKTDEKTAPATTPKQYVREIVSADEGENVKYIPSIACFDDPEVYSYAVFYCDEHTGAVVASASVPEKIASAPCWAVYDDAAEEWHDTGIGYQTMAECQRTCDELSRLVLRAASR
jgi:hypothetical protein